MKHVSTLRALFLISIFVLSACTTSSAGFDAKRADEYTNKPTRLAIMMDFGSNMDKLGNNLPGKMTAFLAACGVESSFDRISDLNIGPLKASLTNPDAVLIVRWKSETKTGYGLIEADYHFELTDVATKKVVWKANLQFHPGADNWADVFAQTVMKGMKGTALLPASCNIA